LVEEYFKDLENIRLSDSKPVTFVDNVFIIVFTFIPIQSVLQHHTILNLYSPHTKPESGLKEVLLKQKKGTILEMAPIRRKKETELNILTTV
jgi:hypothetical protein